MDEITAEMNKLRVKNRPTIVDIRRYVRYLVNVRKYDPESVYEDVPNWDKEEVAKALKEVERENSKPMPKRYFVSLKEPLDEER